MSEYRNFTRRELDNGFVVCEDVHLPSGAVCTVYISPSSIYVISSGRSAPEKRYREIQDLLNAVRIRLYLLPHDKKPDTGLYDPLTNMLGAQLDEDALSEDIYAWLCSGRAIYDASATERMISRLQGADIRARGYAVQENGEIYLLRNGTVKKASNVSSDLQYYLTLFFGPLGFHRFALGKTWSGIVYFLTGGLFLVGWLLDLLQLLAGIQTDKQKRYVLPLSNRKIKLLILPVGLAVGFLLFQLYLKFSEIFGLSLLKLASSQTQNIDPNAAAHFFDMLSRRFPQ